MSAQNNTQDKNIFQGSESASAAAGSQPIERSPIPDDESVCDDDGFIDLDDPANMVVDEGDDDQVHDDEDEGVDEDEGDEAPKEQLLDDNGEPLAQGANLNEEGDHLPPVDDCAAVFYDPESVERIEDEEDENGNAIPEGQSKPYYFRVKPLHTVAAHPKDPSIAAVAGESEAIYLLDIPTGEALKSKAAAKSALRPAADSNESNRIPDHEHGVDPADVIKAKLVLKGHTDTVTAMSFSPQGDLLATGSIDTTVRIWNVATGECVHTLTDLSGEVECLLWHPSGLALLAGSQDAQTIMWNAKKGQVAMYYCGHRGTVTGLLWAADYKKILSCSADGSVMLFNAKTSEVEMAITKGLSEDQAGVVSMALLPESSAAPAAASSPAVTDPTANSETLVVGTEDGTMFVLNLKSKKVVQKLTEVHSQAVEAIVACTDPSFAGLCPFFVSISCDCTVAVWNSRDFSCRSQVNIGEGALAAKWYRDMIAVAASDGVVRFFETRMAVDQQEFVVPYQKEKRFGDEETEEDGQFHTFGNKGRKALFGHRRMIFKMALSCDNEALITVSDDGTARIFGLSA